MYRFTRNYSLLLRKQTTTHAEKKQTLIFQTWKQNTLLGRTFSNIIICIEWMTQNNPWKTTTFKKKSSYIYTQYNKHSQDVFQCPVYEETYPDTTTSQTISINILTSCSMSMCLLIKQYFNSGASTMCHITWITSFAIIPSVLAILPVNIHKYKIQYWTLVHFPPRYFKIAIAITIGIYSTKDLEENLMELLKFITKT